MATATLPVPPVFGLRPGVLLWACATTLAAALWLWGGDALPWAFEMPRAWRPPFAAWISGFLDWLTDDAHFGLFTFRDLTRFLSAIIDVPYQIALGLLSGGGSVFGVGVPPVGWLGVTVLVALLGFALGGVPLAALAGGAFVFIAVFGQWTSAMLTLASILVAVPLGVGGGLLLGIAGHRWPGFGRAIVPLLDLMQTIPIFAYLVPILILFGFGPTSAMIATLIYAMPPMTRITMLALRRVPDEIVDLGRMIGCTRRQMTWQVMVPSAQEALMVGVNQVIMLSLNMVIIASMIGAGGLGFDVLSALRRLDFGAGLEAGLAIVALAIALDRLSQAAARRRPAPVTSAGFVARNPFLVAALAVLVLATVAGLLVPAVQTFPEAWELSTGTFWSDVVAYINVNHFDTIEAVKNAVLLNVLVPVKRFLMSLPWLGVAGLLALAGWRLGGPRLALLTGGLTVLVASTGLWEEAMTTVYLCGISVVIAMLIGLPIGILVAERDRLWAWVRVIIDTLQTLPAFVYLMPAVMLFRVGDFTAMIAIVAFALAPAIRYTVLGLRGVEPALIEAGRAMGCTPWQILTRIRLRLALPEILLGLNQTIMFALSMLVITALVGTRDLGQEVYIALTKADAGRGLVAGLCVAFIAIIADRLIHAAASRSRARLGLTDGAAHDAA
ncbi:ABC transporter permease [Palleronia sp. KMU-117]|uniref:ABC transporter permease n=1 Tax=Palleronia sp. KMU-117 TaxID=3434108 RepID=UPI003D71E253